MADVDIVLKEFWTDKRIAALFNAVFFEEEPVIQADTLHEANPELAASFWNSEIRPIVANRWRDVVRIWTIEWENETYEVLLHMENQKKIDYTTPARIMSHQALDQLREIRKTLDDRQTDPDGTKRASLPSFRRDDRIHPSCSITVYYGDQPWNASKDVKSLFRICPPIEAMCVQFPVKVVDAGHDLLSIPDPDVRDLFRLLRIVYNRDFPPEFRLRALGQYGEEQGTSLLTWRTFGVVSHTDVRPFLEKVSRDQESEDRNMVNIIADAEKHWKAAGEATGEARGIIIAALELGAPESRIVALLAKNLKLTESQARQKYYDYLEAEREKAEENVG